jgi:hypothetical protein
VSKALRYRLFGSGKMPQLLRDAAASASALVAEEGISVKESARGLRLPRRRIGVGSRLLVGSLVILPGRLLAAIGERPFLDTDLRAAENANASLALAADGVRISFDVADIEARASGSVELHFKLAIEPTILASLPAAACPVALADAYPALLASWGGNYSA